MPTPTTLYALQKPLVGSATDADLWGGELNADLDSIDSLLYAGITVASQTIQTAGFIPTVSISVKNLYPCDATGSTFNITLPSAASAANGSTVFIKKIDASANAVVILPLGSDTLDGTASLSLANKNDIYGLVSDGVSKWYSISKTTTPPDATTSVKGIVQLADAAAALAGVSTTLALTPASLLGVNTISTNGFYTLPGGLIMQWGIYPSNVTGDQSIPVTLPTPFLSAMYSTVAMARNTSGGNLTEFIPQYQSNTLSTITYYTNNIAGGNPINGFYWFAIGK